MYGRISMAKSSCIHADSNWLLKNPSGFSTITAQRMHLWPNTFAQEYSGYDIQTKEVNKFFIHQIE